MVMFIPQLMLSNARKFFKIVLQQYIIYQGDWANTEIQFKYEKIKFHDLFNRSMEIVFQKIQKWDI